MTIHTTKSLIAALESTAQYLLDSTGCATVDDVVVLICAVFEDDDTNEDELHRALDPLRVVACLAPAGARGW